MSFYSDGSSLTIAINFETITCYKCGIPFAVPAKMRQELLRTQDTFYCPSGHSQCYTGDTAEHKLRKQLEQKERELANKLTENIQLEGALTKAQRKLKRVAKGVCQCCNRSFEDLKKHMETKHPEVVAKAKK